MEYPESIWLLMARALNSEASPEEREELMQFLRQNEDLQIQYELLTRVWKEKESVLAEDNYAKDHISKIINRAETETGEEDVPVRRRKRRGRLIAASVLLAVVTTGFFIFTSFPSSPSESEPEKNILVAKNGSRTRSQLADGTTVWLNAGSKLFVETDFRNSREVRLEGEAFFDVVKKNNQAFIVHTQGFDIRVLGTVFNVKAYPDDKTMETTLLHGRVQVFSRRDTAKTPIELKPNQKLVLPLKAATEPVNMSDNNKTTVVKAMPRFTITTIDSTKKENERYETAWVYSRLEFQRDNFQELAQKLQRWYNVRIVFTDEKVKQLLFTGSFENETVEEALNAMKIARPFVYKMNKYEISIGSSQ